MYWIFQLIMYACMTWFGPVGISLLFALLWIAVALIWARLVAVHERPFLGGLLFLVFIILAQLRFEPRPEIFSYFFLSVMLLLLNRLVTGPTALTRWYLLAFFVLESLWTGFHGYFVLGPLLALAWVVSLVWERRWSKLRQGLLLLSVLLVASCTSPFGWRVWEGVWQYAQVSRALRDINQELMPPPILPLFWPLTVFWIYWLVAVAYSFGILYRCREKSFAALLCLGGAVMSCMALRNLPVFLILAAPVSGEVLRRLSRFDARGVMRFIPSALAVLLSFLVLRGDYHKSVGSLGSFGFRLERSAYPSEAVEFLKAIDFRGKIFCDSYDGGYLEYFLPEIRIAGDSYFSDGDTTLKFFAAIRRPEALFELDDQMHFDALLINIENLQNYAAVTATPEWKFVHADTHRALFLRRPEGDAVPFTWSQVRFYSGDDLTHWTYAFGVTTWAQIALKTGDIALMKKLVSDVLRAPTAPREVAAMAAELAQKNGDSELNTAAQALEAKAY